MKIPIYDQNLRFEIFKLALHSVCPRIDNLRDVEFIQEVANRIAEFVSPEIPDQDPPDYVNTPEEFS